MWVAGLLDPHGWGHLGAVLAAGLDRKPLSLKDIGRAWPACWNSTQPMGATPSDSLYPNWS
jgi:hypothetical protein